MATTTTLPAVSTPTHQNIAEISADELNTLMRLVQEASLKFDQQHVTPQLSFSVFGKKPPVKGDAVILGLYNKRNRTTEFMAGRVTLSLRSAINFKLIGKEKQWTLDDNFFTTKCVKFCEVITQDKFSKIPSRVKDAATVNDSDYDVIDEEEGEEEIGEECEEEVNEDAAVTGQRVATKSQEEKQQEEEEDDNSEVRKVAQELSDEKKSVSRSLRFATKDANISNPPRPDAKPIISGDLVPATQAMRKATSLDESKRIARKVGNILSGVPTSLPAPAGFAKTMPITTLRTLDWQELKALLFKETEEFIAPRDEISQFTETSPLADIFTKPAISKYLSWAHIRDETTLTRIVDDLKKRALRQQNHWNNDPHARIHFNMIPHFLRLIANIGTEEQLYSSRHLVAKYNQEQMIRLFEGKFTDGTERSQTVKHSLAVDLAAVTEDPESCNLNLLAEERYSEAAKKYGPGRSKDSAPMTAATNTNIISAAPAATPTTTSQQNSNRGGQGSRGGGRGRGNQRRNNRDD